MASGTINVGVSEQITVTAETGNNVSILSQSCRRIGKIVVGWVRFQLGSNLPSYGNIIDTGFSPAHAAAFPLLTIDNAVVANSGIYMDSGNRRLRASVAIPAGTYGAYFFFIAT